MARTITSEEFEALYRAVAPELFGYIRRRGSADAEDLVAEVFTTAWRRRSELPAAMLRRAWLFGTARRLLLAAGRRAQHDQEAVVHLATHPTEQATEDEAAEQVVVAALARLSPDDRELIQLVEWDRLTPAEIAVARGIRPGTARVRLHRARQALASDPQMQALVRRSSASRPALA
ncbi:MAG: sigma-70 family RNA polymerase sigma factor [Nocardioides sp.]|nr:sigma-70 family RNA polymerase sigma factor [Nocardioides sp.]